MKMVITGGAGFIGSHLCEKYVHDGHTVVCLDNFMTGNLTNIRQLLDYRNFKLIKGDIRDFDLLEKVMRDVEVVFHLAAQVHVDRSYIEPRLTYDVNVLGTQNILEAAKMLDVPKVIYASTSEVYGSAMYAPIDEKHPLNAPHPYGASKIAADRMCYAYNITYGMNIAIARSFNVFGPRQRDLGYGGVISIFARRILSGIPPIIYGDGDQKRDYTYVLDTVAAYDALLNHKKTLPGPINFGTGQEISINDLASKIIELGDNTNQMSPVYIEPRIGEVMRLIADFSQAKKILGWQPQYSFEDGLKNFIDWYKQYGFEGRISVD